MLDVAEFTKLREIAYKRYEFHADEDEDRYGTLLIFVYDIPYFGACGVFPPLHITNQIFSRGTSGGGMSPGADWEPFTISADEYAALVDAVQHTPISEIKPHARYASLPFKFDHSFDELSDWLDWIKAVCKKHRKEWHEQLKEAASDH